MSDVEEPVYVSARVLVMTNRPGRVNAGVPVPQPLPDSSDMASSSEFGEIYGEVLETIRDEALRVAELGGALV